MTAELDAFTRALIDDLRKHGGQATIGPMAGRPLMILTTRGAKSRQRRTTVVTYTRDGDRYVIAASNSGAPRHPGWYFNVRSTPTVKAEVGGERFEAVANITTGEERDRLWRQHAAARPEFRAYPSMTDRVIPVICLERTG